MSLNTTELVNSFRESYHDSTRRQIVNLKNQQKRKINSNNLHKVIYTNITAEEKFSE